MHLKGVISTGAYTVLENNSAESISDYLNSVKCYILSKQNDHICQRRLFEK